MDVWTTVKEVGQISENRKTNALFRPIKTNQGNTLDLYAELRLLEGLQPGVSIRMNEPRKGAKGFFATLFEIDPQAGTSGFYNPPKSAPPAPAAKPAAPQVLGGLPPSGNGHQAPGVPTWEECKVMLNAAKDAAWALEPDVGCDPKTNDQYISCSQARAAIVNTIMIAFTNGKVQAPKDNDPEIPGADAPFPDDHELPWERAS